MKKIFKTYSYIFFRLTKYRDEKISTLNSGFSSVCLMSIMCILYFAIAITFFEKLFEVDLIPNTFLENKLYVLLMSTGIFSIHWWLFFKVTNYKKLTDFYSKQNDDTTKVKGYLILSYILIPFILIGVFLFIANVFQW